MSLLVVMVPVLAILFVFSRLNVAVYACPQDPACNQPMMNFGAWTLDWLPIVIFLASVGITIVPTLFIWGDADDTVGRAAAEGTAEFVSAPYRFEILPGGGHFTAEQFPERVAELVLEHLKSTRPI